MKKLFFVILILSFTTLSFADEIGICVKFRKANRSSWQKKIPCPSEKCKPKFSPPPQFYVPTIEIHLVNCGECVFAAPNRRVLRYRDQTFSESSVEGIFDSWEGGTVNWRSDRIMEESVETPDGLMYFNSKIYSYTIVPGNMDVDMVRFFDWELFMNSSRMSVRGELVINLVKGIYEVRGDLKKSCNYL